MCLVLYTLINLVFSLRLSYNLIPKIYKKKVILVFKLLLKFCIFLTSSYKKD